MKSDLVFFPDEDARQAAVTAQRTEEYIADALAVGEFKGGGPSFNDQNPNFQIDYYPTPTT
jgi:hypothetical protein